MLKEAGLDRINHNLNSSRAYYHNICSTHTFEQRVANIKMLQGKVCMHIYSVINRYMSKEDIDDVTTDAINEIVSNICGSFCTASNAQGMPDIVGMKSEIKGTKKVEKSALSGKEIYLFNISLEEDATPILISFEKTFSPFFSLITGVNDEKPVVSTPTAPAAPTITQTQSIVGVPNPSKNLELLYNVRLKLSVRLGTKIVLLKDILRWDVGEIIELEQMVNEPLEILINGVKIGEGEAVIVEGKFGLKIKKIINEDLKLDKIGL